MCEKGIGKRAAGVSVHVGGRETEGERVGGRGTVLNGPRIVCHVPLSQLTRIQPGSAPDPRRAAQKSSKEHHETLGPAFSVCVSTLAFRSV
jgi:hypothetical protein